MQPHMSCIKASGEIVKAAGIIENVISKLPYTKDKQMRKKLLQTYNILVDAGKAMIDESSRTVN